MQEPQTQKTNKSENFSQSFNDLLKSLIVVLDKLYKENSLLAIFFLFFILICLYLLFKVINTDYIYSLVVTLLFIFLSICLYIKEKSSLSAVFSFSLGIFTAFTVTWNGTTFSIFFISFIILIISVLFIASIRAAANEEEKMVTAANSYINDFETNKKDLQDVYATVKQQTGLLPIGKKQGAILFFAYQKVPKQQIITLIDVLNFIYTITKLDTELLLVLLINVYYLSHTENDLAINIATLKLYILKGKSTPKNLVTVLNDTLHIAIENDTSFVLFTDTILTYLSRGYAQISIVDQLSRKFTKQIT